MKEYIVATFLPEATVDQLEPGYDLLANGVIDSLGLLKLIGWLTERYSLPIDDVDIAPENFATVDAICRFIRKATVRELDNDSAKARRD